jgi:hypothetical protein
VVNFLDIDGGRPENSQLVRVVDLSTGKEIATFEWDPRPFRTKPALSASGHKLARIRGGILEVFNIN